MCTFPASKHQHCACLSISIVSLYVGKMVLFIGNALATVIRNLTAPATRAAGRCPTQPVPCSACICGYCEAETIFLS